MISRQTLPGGTLLRAKRSRRKLGKSRVVHRRGAQVDGAGVELGQGLRVALEPGQRAVHHMAIEARPHVELLGRGDHRARRQHLAGVRVDHAQQDLEVPTAVLDALQAGDALAVEAEVAIAQCGVEPEGPAQRGRVLGHGVGGRFESREPQPVVALVLRGGAAGVRKAQQFGVVGLPAAEADGADAGRRGHEVPAAALPVVAHRSQHVVEHRGVRRRIPVVQQRDELVAGQPADKAAARQHGPQRPSGSAARPSA
ncbi:hypothetical protein [Silanimonas sp.]|uniref:hypothetical protein n=1 Tax=Silanimonas sp. TaxID=1929290 RepID=UPI0022C908CF|nr:hypothetical protein [Silanimonas sp.]MCZ8063739.1 hypothetical protein [Silanimonas sp.]